MSKKAKLLKRSQKRNKTIVDGLKCEVNNYKSLAEQHENSANRYRQDVIAAEKRSDELSTMNRSLIDQKGRWFETANELKRIIADNERAVAERDGTIRELRRQIDQAAPKVMVKPAVFVSPQEAGNHPMVASGRDLEAFRETWAGGAATAAAPKKHWTAL